MLVELVYKSELVDQFTEIDSKKIAGTLEKVRLTDNGCVHVTVSGKVVKAFSNSKDTCLLSIVNYQEGTGLNPASFGSCTTVADMSDADSVYTFFKKLLFNGTP
jgi:hypothetical protein